MRLKLDENLGRRGVELFRKAGHDVVTVIVVIVGCVLRTNKDA